MDAKLREFHAAYCAAYDKLSTADEKLSDARRYSELYVSSVGNFPEASLTLSGDYSDDRVLKIPRNLLSETVTEYISLLSDEVDEAEGELQDLINSMKEDDR